MAISVLGSYRYENWWF
uniref:Poly [ADP-ribose] polymerase n=1 Tax=Triatoma infestans TaxID=30076 RepID=A0A161MBA3_TRIIF